ncbi:hypothetical protein BH23GEM6_BH23GEM6_04430 [soil metagenome]
MKQFELRSRCVDLPLVGGRTIRASLSLDVAGEPETLVLAAGWSDPFVACERLTLPHEAARLIRDALTALLEADATLHTPEKLHD